MFSVPTAKLTPRVSAKWAGGNDSYGQINFSAKL